MTIYRFELDTPTDAALSAYVSGSPTVNARGAALFVDIDAAPADLTDLQEYMTTIGWSYVGASPSTTPSQETATDLPAFGSSTKGVVPASGGGTANFLRADGTWAAPSGGAPTSASYVVMSLDGTLTAERALAVTAPVTLSDGGAGGNATIAVSTFGAGASGVVPASGGGTTNFLRADGTWTSPGASSFSATETTVDFGTVPLTFRSFDVAHVGAVTANKVIASISATMPAGVDVDELEMDPLIVSGYVPTDGTVRLLVSVAADRGKLVGQRKINYALG